ncbi:MAG: hypothetical protein JTT15_06995 [Candidatus Brockarchaeota archaeon]|nr:hypothetical protein [Candidatus Brockarchaeota archaeon]
MDTTNRRNRRIKKKYRNIYPDACLTFFLPVFLGAIKPTLAPGGALRLTEVEPPTW